MVDNEVWIAELRSEGACVDATLWCQRYDRSAHAWQACFRPEWLAWLLMRRRGRSRQAPVRRFLVGLVCRTLRRREARGALGPRGKTVPRQVLHALERWAVGDGTMTTDQALAWASKLGKWKTDWQQNKEGVDIPYSATMGHGIAALVDTLEALYSNDPLDVPTLMGSAIEEAWRVPQDAAPTIKLRAWQCREIRWEYPKPPRAKKR